MQLNIGKRVKSPFRALKTLGSKNRKSSSDSSSLHSKSSIYRSPESLADAKEEKTIPRPIIEEIHAAQVAQQTSPVAVEVKKEEVQHDDQSKAIEQVVQKEEKPVVEENVKGYDVEANAEDVTEDRREGQTGQMEKEGLSQESPDAAVIAGNSVDQPLLSSSPSPSPSPLSVPQPQLDSIESSIVVVEREAETEIVVDASQAIKGQGQSPVAEVIAEEPKELDSGESKPVANPEDPFSDLHEEPVFVAHVSQSSMVDTLQTTAEIDAKMDVDPFIVDEPDLPATSLVAPPSPPVGPVSDPQPVYSAPLDDPLTSSVALTETPLTPPHETANSELPLAPVDVNKAVPSPATGSDSEEDEAPELAAPGLTVPTLFLPIPNTDPLTTLLIKHVPEPHLRPQRDVTGEWQHTDFHTLVMTNNWRALAKMARDRLVKSDPSDVELILNLWYIRLSSLARLRLFNHTSAECENLFSALSQVTPPAARAYILSNVLPFELEVLRARCTYWAGDPIGYLDDLRALLRRCRIRARKSRNPSEQSMWKERGARMVLCMASELVELKDYTASVSLLIPLLKFSHSLSLRSAVARIYLQGGNTALAAYHFSEAERESKAEESPDLLQLEMNTVLLAACEGRWDEAIECAKAMSQTDPDNILIANNLAVSLLNQGRLKEAIEVLERVLHNSPAAVTTVEPYLFNLSTLYELRSNLTLHKKHDLLIEVAKWSGDGLRATCLKMPS